MTFKQTDKHHHSGCCENRYNLQLGQARGSISAIRPLRDFCRTSENIWQNNGLTNVGLDYTDTHRPQL